MTVEELLKQKKIYYKVSGRDFVTKCFNPEHEDTDPSMRIDRLLGIFNCLSCGHKGNLFYKYDVAFDKLAVLRETLSRKIEDIRSESTGLKMPSIMYPVTSDYRVSLETLTEFEAFRSIGPDFEERIVFPIKDLKGKIVCFVGRSEIPFAKAKKYLIRPESAKVPLFPLQKLKPESGRIILVEGLFDLLNLWDHSYRNVLCTFGTNTVKREKLSLLKILGITGIDIMFDPDDPGQTAAEELKTMAEEEYFDVRNINLKSCDPGDLPRERALRLKETLYA